MCGPGLTCQKEAGANIATCIPMSTDCVLAQLKYDEDLDSGNLGMDMLRPQCDDHGYWAPVQCTGSDVCRCVDKETGKPIFGVETNMTSVDMMTCECARHDHLMKEMGCNMKVKYDGDSQVSKTRFKADYEQCMRNEANEYFTGGHLRCEPNGNYDEAQCVKQTYDDGYHPGYDLEKCFCLPENLVHFYYFSLKEKI